MKRDLPLFIISILIILIVAFSIVILNLGKFSNKKSASYSYLSDSKITAQDGYVSLSDNKQNALVIGKMKDVYIENGKVFMDIYTSPSSGIVYKTLAYDGNLPFVLRKQTTLYLYPITKEYQMKIFKRSTNPNDVYNSLKGLINVPIIFYIDLPKTPGINNEILDCNNQLLTAIQNASTVNCIPIVRYVGYYDSNQ